MPYLMLLNAYTSSPLPMVECNLRHLHILFVIYNLFAFGPVWENRCHRASLTGNNNASKKYT